MTPQDLADLITASLGITREDLLLTLLTLVTLAPVVSWLRPRVDPVLARWAAAAKATTTLADDRAVSVVGVVWRVLVALPAAALRVIPVFATQAEVEDLQAKRREAKLLESRK